MRTPHGLMHNEQDAAWRGNHGNDYNRRSPGNEQANYMLFRRALRHDGLGFPLEPASILELGAGTGANIRALARLVPQARIDALEINEQACQVLMTTAPVSNVHCFSALEWQPSQRYDLVLTKGFLIHIAPENLPLVYAMMVRAAARWILICEYYNPTPLAVAYRGQSNLLWKRDFAGDLLERCPELVLRDYGFVYRRDRHPQDDLTWFLLEKPAAQLDAARAAA